jgi:hypothetical protein
MAPLEVLDRGHLIRFSFEDLLKYHGRGAVGGVAHGFKVLERGLPLLADGEPPERADVSVETAFGGAGARDAIEMVTRAVTGGRFSYDPGIAPEAPVAPIGRYFFRLIHRAGTVVDLTLRPGLVLDEFTELATRGPATPDEERRLEHLKQEMADRLMSLSAAEVYDARTPGFPTPG